MRKDVVIIGGGFAGRQAARVLANSGAQVALFDPNPVSTMLPALPDLAGGWIPEDLVSRPLSELLPRSVELIPQTVAAVNLDAGILVAGNENVEYRFLLLAAGSTPNFHNVKFPRERLYALGSLADALRIRREFENYLRDAKHPQLLVAGTGYTGLELALSLFFRARAAGKPCPAAIVDPTPILLPSLPEKQRQYVLDFLTGQGVDVRLGVGVETYDGRTAVAGGRAYENPFFCWAAGSTFAIPNIEGRVARLRDGRLKVNPDLSLPGYPNVFAAGDSAAIERHGQALRKAVNFAYYGGRHAGHNIARRLRGRPPRPFRPVDLGWIVPFHSTSIGRLPGGVWIHGPLGVRLHHLMCGVRNYTFKNFAGCLKLAWKPYKKGNHP